MKYNLKDIQEMMDIEGVDSWCPIMDRPCLEFGCSFYIEHEVDEYKCAVCVIARDLETKKC